MFSYQNCSTSYHLTIKFAITIEVVATIIEVSLNSNLGLYGRNFIENSNYYWFLLSLNFGYFIVTINDLHAAITIFVTTVTNAPCNKLRENFSLLSLSKQVLLYQT